jgi:hypothetical protein
MDSSNPNIQKKLLTLNEAAQELGISVDSLLQLNDFDILKPSITPDGEVGYTRQQIEKFLAVQRLSLGRFGQEKEDALQSKIIPIGQGVNKTDLQALPQINSLVINNMRNVYVEPEILKASGVNRNKFFSFKMMSSFSAVIIIILLATMQIGKLKPIISQEQQLSQKETGGAKAVLASQINDSDYSPVQTGSILPDNSFGNSGTTALEDKSGTNFKGKIQGAIAGNDLSQPSFALSKLAGKGGSNSAGSVGYSEVGNFPKNANTADNLFDAGGNIRGEAGQGVLAMAFGVAGVSQANSSIKPVTDSNILLTFLTLGLMYVIYILRKQLMYSAKISASMVPHSFQDSVEKKILEVNQKTDGTVALNFKGREYKLCKPDLDSESDQFIERLMRLAVPGVKEIDYDSLNDEEISFNASLSKLVTRLGFVGIKRDLFFPRTSKNRVLFRRYVTEQDLVSMNLSASDFKQIFE